MDFIKKQLDGTGMSEQTIGILSNIIMVIFIAVVSILANYIAKRIVLKTVHHIVNNNRYKWGHIIVEKKLFHKLSHLVPAIIIYYSAYVFPSYQALIEKAAMTYMIVIMITVLNALLNVFDDIYRSYEVSKIRPIKGYIQVAKIILFIIGGIIVISSLIGQNPLIILSGLGALSAVLMLVFKDSILGPWQAFNCHRMTWYVLATGLKCRNIMQMVTSLTLHLIRLR